MALSTMLIMLTLATRSLGIQLGRLTSNTIVNGCEQEDCTPTAVKFAKGTAGTIGCPAGSVAATIDQCKAYAAGLPDQGDCASSAGYQNNCENSELGWCKERPLGCWHTPSHNKCVVFKGVGSDQAYVNATPICVRVDKVPKRIFIDLGANCGNSLALVKEKLPEVSDFSDFYLWEANPDLVKFYLLPLVESNPRIHVLQNAAWIEDTNLTFYLTAGQENWTKEQYENSGFRCDPHSEANPQGASSVFADHDRRGRSIEVVAKNFRAWTESLVLQLQDSEVLEMYMKIDIEGAEYPLLQSFLDSTVFCNVTHWMIEWHPSIAKSEQEASGMQVAFNARVDECERRGHHITIMPWH